MKYIVRKSWFAAEEGEILTKETQAPFCLVNSRDVQIVVEYNIQNALDQGFIEPYEEKPKASSTEVSKFIKEMKYIERSDDSPIMEYLMELARAVEHDLADNEVSDE